jgi:hypothetical protein
MWDNLDCKLNGPSRFLLTLLFGNSKHSSTTHIAYVCSLGCLMDLMADKEFTEGLDRMLEDLPIRVEG